MMNKYYIKEQYLLDLESGTLHDLKGNKDADNRGCGLDRITRSCLFDARHLPELGKELRVHTPGGKKKILIKAHCPHCLET